MRYLRWFQIKKPFEPDGLYNKYFSVVKVNPYSAAIYIRRQNMTSVDVIFWRLMSL